MLNLADTTPLLMLQKQRLSRTKIEAILYGQSGLLKRKYVDVILNSFKTNISFILKNIICNLFRRINGSSFVFAQVPFQVYEFRI
jgi:hypothetical protein